MAARKPSEATVIREWRQGVADYRLDTEPMRCTSTLTCEAVDTAEEARSALATNGTTFIDQFGAPRARPEVAIERDSRIAA